MDAKTAAQATVGRRVKWGILPDTTPELGTIVEVGYNAFKVKWDTPDPDSGTDHTITRFASAHSFSWVR